MEANDNNFVYLLTNTVLNGEWVKIGCCKFRPNADSLFIKHPDLPLPYDIRAVLETPKAKEVMGGYGTVPCPLKAIDGTAQLAAQSGTVVVAKIGKESLKIAVK